MNTRLLGLLFRQWRTGPAKSRRLDRSAISSRIPALAAALLFAAAAFVSAAGVVYTVDTTDDTEPVAPVAFAKDTNGKTSLRAALMAANVSPGTAPITINFNISVLAGLTPQIGLGSLLPEIVHPVAINGFSQPDLPAGRRVGLAPASGVSLEYGLFIVGGRSVVTGLNIEGFSEGILIQVLGSNAVQGCRFANNEIGVCIGTYRANDPSGGSFGNLIGGLAPETRNVFVANTLCGILAFYSESNVIAGNVIGIDDDNFADGNGWGIILTNSNKDVVGGKAPGSGNIIANSVRDGVTIAGGLKSLVYGNTIVQNQRHGVVLCSGLTDPGTFRHAIGNRIGGSSLDGTGNVISGNAKDGVLITSDASVKGLNKVQGNLIGTDETGTVAAPNDTGVAIRGSSSNLIGGTKAGLPNVISGNSNVGINIFGAAVTLKQLLTDTPPSTTVFLETRFNIVQGNFIGTEPSANAALGNGAVGVGIGGARDSVIGGTKPEAGNLIANNVVGILIVNTSGVPAILNQIIGNTIKKNDAIGVSFNNDVTGNVIGGKTKGLGNVIADNGSDDASHFGVNFNVNAKNGILGNSIVENGDGGTVSGIGGMGGSPGLMVGLQSLSRKAGKTIVDWTLSDSGSPPGKSTYRLEFFANSSAAKAQGETYLGATMASLVNGDPITGTMTLAGFPDHITATATLLGSKGAPVVTSRFSTALENPPAAAALP